MSSSAVTVQAPASKSLSHRALICAALANGESRLSGVLESQDTARTMGCLTACGAAFSRLAPGEYLVRGMPGGPDGEPGGGPLGGTPEAPADLNVGESGTTCRLLAGVAAAGQGSFRLHGEGRMHQRPLGEPARALASQPGVSYAWEGTPGFPPVTIHTTGLSGGDVSVSLEESSQYLSGILLAAPLAKAPLSIAIGGTKAVSWPYVSLTLQAMADFGAPAVVEVLGPDGVFAPAPHASVTRAEPGRLRFRVQPGAYAPRNMRVEGDWSNASYFLAAGALGRVPVRVEGLRQDSLQGDRAILDILGAMGARIDWDAEGVTVFPSRLSGVRVDMGACPDLAPTVAVAACFAATPTTIHNVAHLRIKESDRLEALATELAKTGCTTETFADGLTITPAPLTPGREIAFDTRGDHRLAMGPALFALGGLKPVFDNPGCVAKSFPGFWGAFEPILAAQAEARG